MGEEQNYQEPQILNLKWTTTIDDIGPFAARFQIVMDSTRVASLLFGLDRRTGKFNWQLPPAWPREYLKAFALHGDILIAAGHELGLYRFDADTGAPLLVDRPETFRGRIQRKRDIRNLNSSMVHASPFVIQDGKIVTRMGYIVDIATGMEVGQIGNMKTLEKESRTLESRFHCDGLVKVSGAGVLHAGEPYGNNKFAILKWPLDWYFTTANGDILSHWKSLDLGISGDVRPYDHYSSVLVQFPYAYIILSDNRAGTDEHQVGSFYVVVVDLRSGETAQIVVVGENPVRSASFGVIDGAGLVIHSRVPKSNSVTVHYYALGGHSLDKPEPLTSTHCF